mmetsp:Transcript_23996/g.95222  ORF Transcript_23996/g.95222 Transcript_23996/m.95222 type:complete len:430 (+) Transcript_23996:342-1631(+)
MFEERHATARPHERLARVRDGRRGLYWVVADGRARVEGPRAETVDDRRPRQLQPVLLAALQTRASAAIAAGVRAPGGRGRRVQRVVAGGLVPETPVHARRPPRGAGRRALLADASFIVCPQQLGVFRHARRTHPQDPRKTTAFIRVCVVLFGIRTQPQDPVLRDRRRDVAGQSVRRLEIHERADRRGVPPHLRPPVRGAPLLHGVRPLGPTRHGGVSVHARHRNGQTAHAVQPGQNAPRLHLHRRHRRRRRALDGALRVRRDGVQPRQQPPRRTHALHRNDRTRARRQSADGPQGLHRRDQRDLRRRPQGQGAARLQAPHLRRGRAPQLHSVVQARAEAPHVRHRRRLQQPPPGAPVRSLSWFLCCLPRWRCLLRNSPYVPRPAPSSPSSSSESSSTWSASSVFVPTCVRSSTRRVGVLAGERTPSNRR